jgi:hypothetical protein
MVAVVELFLSDFRGKEETALKTLSSWRFYERNKNEINREKKQSNSSSVINTTTFWISSHRWQPTLFCLRLYFFFEVVERVGTT